MPSSSYGCDCGLEIGGWRRALWWALPALGAGAVLYMLKRRYGCHCGIRKCNCTGGKCTPDCQCGCGGNKKDSTCCSTTADHPRNVVPKICKEFHQKGWMTGSGGAIGMRKGDEIFVSPSGIPKEMVEADTLFVCDINAKPISGPDESKKLKESTCAPMFMNAFQKRGAGAVFHIHSQNAVMVTMLFPGKEFRITHQQMLKAILNYEAGRNYRFDEELVIPIVENENEELDIKDNIVAAMEEYPSTCAVLVRRHGIYLWGETWLKAKIMCESYDYIFETVVRMYTCGLDPTKKHKSS